MARVATPNGGLGVWLDGEAPGAGDQVSDNNGLNGNFIKTDKLFIEHATDGTHRDDKINGNSLKSSVADGTTLETSASSGAKTLRIKDAGVSATKLASDAVTTVKILDANVTTAKLASNAVTTVKITDANVTLAKLAADSVDSSKITHDNTRTKVIINGSLPTSGKGYVGNLQFTASMPGVPMPRAGHITKVNVVDSAGVANSTSEAYATSGARHFAVNDLIGWSNGGVGLNIALQKNGVGDMLGGVLAGIGGNTMFITLEIEFDD